MSLEVLRPGLLTTVQDLGRPGHQKEGVPVGGAMDTVAIRIANLLVGNDEDAAALEITILGPTLRFRADALFALCGADFDATIGGHPVPVWRPVRVHAGATLEISGAASGCRACLAVAGGIAVPVVLGSRSTHLHAGFGGLAGRALREGDVVRIGPPPPLALRLASLIPADGVVFAPAGWSAAGAILAGYAPNPEIRLIRGPEFQHLAPASRDRLFDAVFRVAPESDRMGYRLAGPPLELQIAAEMLSEGVAAGTLQLPPGGAPIALMADRQTTGGYPRIGQIASVDLPVMAQLRPGDMLRFREISLGEAQEAYIERERALAVLREGIRLRGEKGKGME